MKTIFYVFLGFAAYTIVAMAFMYLVLGQPLFVHAAPAQAQAAPADFGYIQYTSARLAVIDGEVRGYWPATGTYEPLDAWGSGCWQLVAVTRTVSAVDYAVFSRPFGVECNGEGAK